MATRRAPLASVPNAVNSPFRNVAAGAKRTRAPAGDQREAVYGQPPAKKQIIEISDDGTEGNDIRHNHNNAENVDPRKRNGVAVTARDKLDEPFSKRTTNVVPTAFERKLASVREDRSACAREKKPATQQRATDKAPKAEANNLETVRQWQRHYRRQFPQFVIYFESVPDEQRARVVQQVRSLGAREEKFFSKTVTHVVTTRPIPPEVVATSPDEGTRDGGAQQSLLAPPPIRPQDQKRTTSMLDTHLQRRAQTQMAQGQSTDILTRAREYNIKIWALEKLHRILRTMLDTDTGEQAAVPDTARTHAAVTKAAPKPTKDVDLEQLLRNEKVNGPADRDMSVAAQDMAQFRGFYIYIHDMDEKTKPVMIRDYPKPQTKEQGKWPQFRLTPAGRCPFVEDPAHTRKLQLQDRETAKAQGEIALAQQRRTRATSAHDAAARAVAPVRALAERPSNLRRSPRKVAPGEMSKPLDPPKLLPTNRQSSNEGMPPLFGSAQQSLRGLPRTFGGEPVASGIQPSNVTSAIRSQIISSAAISSTAPGAGRRIGDSKEVSALKRKVLERGANVTSNHSMPSSYMNDMRAALNNDNEPPPRAAKRRALETLGVLHEDDQDVQDGQPRMTHRKASAPRETKPVEKDAKPGYCENCRDKFEDFDEHVASRKHRKFGLTLENWKELDALLTQLKRPHKRV